MADRLRRVKEAPSHKDAPPVSTRPRANPDRDDDDVKRGEEKLGRVVGK